MFTTPTIDTGASRSFVSEAVARRLTTARNQRSVCTRINLADGTLRDVTQAHMVSIHCGQRQVPIPVLILPTLLNDIILGMDFLCGMGARIGCGPTQLQLRPTTTAIPIATVTTVRTLPKVELTVDQTGAMRTLGLPGVFMEAVRKNPFRKPRIAAKAAREETQARVHDRGADTTGTVRRRELRGISTEEEAWINRFLQEELLPFDQITGVSPIAEHTIVLRDNRPIKQRYYPKNPAMLKIIDAQEDELLRDGRIEPSKSPHSAPIVLVGKKTGDMCIHEIEHHSQSLAVKVPPFWAERPEIWFAQIESQFCIAGITADKTKFHTVLASIESCVISQITDAILNPPAVDMYGNLKRNIIERFCESEQKKIQKLLSDIDLGDRRPTQLLNELRGLAKDRINEDFLKSFWMQRLPPHAQAILQASNDDLSGMAKLADKILEVEGLAHMNVASVAVPAGSTSLPAHSLHEIVTRLDSLEKRIRSRSRSQSRSLANRDQISSPSECWYHSKFGSKATKCMPPCSYKSDSKN
ncbi:hypothetical protein ACLKA7_017676 [Drosophila subpalustris]